MWKIKLLFILIILTLILSACGSVADNPDGYYIVSLTNGNAWHCEHICWENLWLTCDNHIPVNYKKVLAVDFIFEGE